MIRGTRATQSSITITLFAVLGLGGGRLSAEDFSLSQDGIGPISIHTALTGEGKMVHLVATARNDSNTAIELVQLCVVLKKGECQFEPRYTAKWPAGTSLNWDMTATRQSKTLAHDVKIVMLRGPMAESLAVAVGAPPDDDPAIWGGLYSLEYIHHLRRIHEARERAALASGNPLPPEVPTIYGGIDGIDYRFHVRDVQRRRETAPQATGNAATVPQSPAPPSSTVYSATGSQFDLAGARRAGYTDDELLAYLAQWHNYNVQAGLKAGYSKTEIMEFLAIVPRGSANPAPPAPTVVVPDGSNNPPGTCIRDDSALNLSAFGTAPGQQAPISPFGRTPAQTYTEKVMAQRENDYRECLRVQNLAAQARAIGITDPVEIGRFINGQRSSNPPAVADPDHVKP